MSTQILTVSLLGATFNPFFEYREQKAGAQPGIQYPMRSLISYRKLIYLSVLCYHCIFNSTAGASGHQALIKQTLLEQMQHRQDRESYGAQCWSQPLTSVLLSLRTLVGKLKTPTTPRQEHSLHLKKSGPFFSIRYLIQDWVSALGLSEVVGRFIRPRFYL